MAASRADIFKGALTLNPSDRADLIGVLISSLDAVSEEDVEEAWRVEFERRASELESGAVTAIPWEVVRERLARAPHGQGICQVSFAGRTGSTTLDPVSPLLHRSGSGE
jgi:putative addiction module component (TIGR02574 family)